MKINENKIEEYTVYLIEEERSKNTVDKYIRDIRTFLMYVEGEILSKNAVIRYKQYLVEKYATSSVNSMLAAVNGFLEWLGMGVYKVKPLKVQKEIFTNPEKELSQVEYERLIHTAQKKENTRLSLLIQTICSTGIRVSELQYITVEALCVGKVIVVCKGKQRVVFLSKELCRTLKKYCRDNQITEGVIFRSKKGNPLDRSNIWKMMKQLCKDANVAESKVFPHNLRHLFARTFYKIEKDISRLADILGHSNINTTRIYTMESGVNHMKQMEKMQLIIARA